MCGFFLYHPLSPFISLVLTMILLCLVVLFCEDLLLPIAYLLPPEYIALAYILSIYHPLRNKTITYSHIVYGLLCVMPLSMCFGLVSGAGLSTMAIFPLLLCILSLPVETLSIGALVICYKYLIRSYTVTAIPMIFVGIEIYNNIFNTPEAYDNRAQPEVLLDHQSLILRGFFNGVIPGFIEPYLQPNSFSQFISEISTFSLCIFFRPTGKSVLSEIMMINYSDSIPSISIGIFLIVGVGFLYKLKDLSLPNFRLPYLPIGIIAMIYFINSPLALVLISIGTGFILGFLPQANRSFISWLVLTVI